jgi:hypothetical protein
MKTIKNILPSVMRVSLLAVILLIFNVAGCTMSDGRDFGGTIWGTTSSANDKAVGNAMISLNGSDIFAVTKSDGYFSIKGIPEGNYELTLSKFGYELFKGNTSVSHGLMNLSKGDARVADAVTLFDFPSGVPGDQFLGCTILDENDDPVVGAEIDLIYTEAGFFYVTQTDQAGSFYFEDILPNADLLIIDAVGFKPAVFNFEDINTFMSNGTDGALVNLIPLEKDVVEDTVPVGSVAGTVVDRENKILPGISVALVTYDPDKPAIMSPAKIVETDNEGKFTFDGVEPGEYFVWVGHPNYFPDDKPVTVEADIEKSVNFTLDEATDEVIHPYLRPSLE